VQCLDVESCAAIGSNGSNAALPRPRYALVLSHYGVPTNRLLQSIKSMRAAALAAGADILVPWLFRGLQVLVSSSLDGIWKAVRSLGSSIHCIELPHASGANDAGPCGSDELQIAEALEEMACEAWFWMFWQNLVGFRQAILFSLTKGVPLISFSGSQMPRKVHLVPWALPPGMIYIKKVTKYDGWCGKMDPGCTARCVLVGS